LSDAVESLTFVGQHGVVLRRNIIRQIVIQNKAEQTVKKCKIDLLVNLGEYCFHHDIALSLTGLPNIGQVVDALTPFVDEKRWGLRVL
jgi:hypothetical protein